MRFTCGLAATLTILCSACSANEPDVVVDGGTTPSGGQPNAGGATSGGGGSNAGGVVTGPTTGGSGTVVMLPEDLGCKEKPTCAKLGWACGYTVDRCGNRIDCAAEGLVCRADQVCSGVPTECRDAPGPACPVCSAIPNCSTAPEPTRLVGRVVTPGRTDTDVANQVGVPNAIVYVLGTTETSALPAIPTGIPADGTACDRCDEQDLGQVLTGAVSDATGAFVLEERLPVGREFVLVVKAGRFRRATTLTLPASAACQTTTLPSALPDNPARLPRSMSDGLAVNIPRIAVSTGQIDAMECVLEKMGLSHDEFGNPGADAMTAARVHLYRGGPPTGTPPGAGARIDDNTPHDSMLYGDPTRLLRYDLVVADCEGETWDGDSSDRDASGPNLRQFVNRGGRLFASHLSLTWLDGNGTAPYVAGDFDTGLDPAATWNVTLDSTVTGTGAVSLGRPSASPRIQSFADWMANEGIAAPPAYDFAINEPRSPNTGLGPASEEFVYLTGGTERAQQFSFNTPYGAPAEAACGRVAYSGFHVSVGGGTSPFAEAIFPAHCVGDLTAQEKVLLYMLFDLGACVGEDPPPPPPCVPETCMTLQATCGFAPDGCGNVLDCGPCDPPE